MRNVLYLCVNQCSPEKQDQEGILIYWLIVNQLIDLFWGIGSCNDSGWEVLQSATCKGEAREADDVDLVPTERPESQWSLWCKSERVPKGLRSRRSGPRVGEDWCHRSRRTKSPYHCLFNCISPLSSVDWVVPTHPGAGSLLYSVYLFKCYFLLQTSFRHFRK